MKFSLLIITFNELVSSKIILPRINKNLFHEIIVVDGGSTDGTIAFMRKENFKVIVQDKIKLPWYNFAKKQTNIAKEVSLGVNNASGDVIILFTPDGNMLPEKLDELVEISKKGYDLVCVSRYKDGAKSLDDTYISSFGNYFFTNLVNLLFGSNYTDVLGGYKAVRKKIWDFINVENKMLVSFGTQLSIVCAKNKLNITEISGDEPKRIAGKSSTNTIINGIIELFTILQAFLKEDLYRFK